jgi:hypothetical protein
VVIVVLKESGAHPEQSRRMESVPGSVGGNVT